MLACPKSAPAALQKATMADMQRHAVRSLRYVVLGSLAVAAWFTWKTSRRTQRNVPVTVGACVKDGRAVSGLRPPVRRRRQQVVLFSPLLPLVAAAASVFGYFALEATTGSNQITTNPPLQVGVYMPMKYEKYVDKLLTSAHASVNPEWQLQITAISDGFAVIDFNLGPAVYLYNGEPVIRHTVLSAHGSLPAGLDVAFSFPPGTKYGNGNLTELEWALNNAGLETSPDSTCASWADDSGRFHTVLLHAARDKYGDIVACAVPRIDSFKDFSLSVVAEVPIASLKESLGGASYMSVVNPLNVNEVETMSQSTKVSTDLDFAPAKSYDLAVRIPDRLTYNDLEPGPTSVGQQTRHWTVNPGSYVSVTMEDQQRRTLLDVAQQVLLILAGIFLGLIPAALTLTTRTRRKLHATSQPGRRPPRTPVGRFRVDRLGD